MKRIEYEVIDFEGELVNCFTWGELLNWMPSSYQPSTIRKAIQRGTVIDGLTITKVSYDDEIDY